MNDLVALVILNYNTAKDSIRLATGLLQHLSKDYHVVLVDNASKDVNELEHFVQNISPDRIDLLKVLENGGYAKGNNVGLRWAFEHGFKFAFIINPDIEICDYDVFAEQIGIMKADVSVGMVGPRIVNPLGISQDPPMRMTEYMLYSICYPFSALVRKIKNARSLARRGYIRVFTVHGCFLGLDLSKWNAIGFYDERTFLYHEEAIIAERLKNQGFRVAWSPRYQVTHLHVYSPESLEAPISKESWAYYCQFYLKKGRAFFKLKAITDKYERTLRAVFQGVLGQKRVKVKS